jgi:hypothetical protein
MDANCAAVAAPAARSSVRVDFVTWGMDLLRFAEVWVFRTGDLSGMVDEASASGSHCTRMNRALPGGMGRESGRSSMTDGPGRQR